MFFVALLIAAGVAVAQEAASPEPLVFRLEHVPDEFSVHLYIDTETTEVAFKQEPEYEGSVITRGAIFLGSDPEDFIGFACDHAAHKLYVDKNGNLDLTDDPDNVYTSIDSFFLEFEGIRLQRNTEAGVLPYVLNVEIFSFGFSAVYCTAIITSGWRGTVELGGTERIFAVVDNGDGMITNDDEFVFGPTDTLEFANWDEHVPASQRLFLNGHAYDLSFEFEEEDLVVTAAASSEPMGTLNLEGEHIARLILAGSDNAFTILADSLEREMAVPAGIYDHQELYLLAEGGDTAFYTRAAHEITVREGAQAALAMGGPLRNSLTYRRAGRTLTFSHEFLGVGGETYDPVGVRRPAPQVVVYRDGKQIASGAFEYG